MLFASGRSSLHRQLASDNLPLPAIPADARSAQRTAAKVASRQSRLCHHQSPGSLTDYGSRVSEAEPEPPVKKAIGPSRKSRQPIFCRRSSDRGFRDREAHREVSSFRANISTPKVLRKRIAAPALFLHGATVSKHPNRSRKVCRNEERPHHISKRSRIRNLELWKSQPARISPCLSSRTTAEPCSEHAFKRGNHATSRKGDEKALAPKARPFGRKTPTGKDPAERTKRVYVARISRYLSRQCPRRQAHERPGSIIIQKADTALNRHFRSLDQEKA